MTYFNRHSILEKPRRKKLEEKSISELLKLAQKKFNAFIRERDRGRPCINCGKFKSNIQAGHYFSVGGFPALRFDEDNVHGECVACNFYNSQSHSFGYRKNLLLKIGQQRFDSLELRAQMSKRGPHKWDRFTLLEIINRYSNHK